MKPEVSHFHQGLAPKQLAQIQNADIRNVVDGLESFLRKNRNSEIEHPSLEILIIGGEKIACSLAGNTLKHLRYNVTSVNNSSDALWLLRLKGNNFALILSHAFLTDTTAVELIPEIKPITEAPIIVLLGSKNCSDLVEQLIAVGCHDYIDDTIPIEGIKHRVHSYLKNIWLDRALKQFEKNIQVDSCECEQYFQQYEDIIFPLREKEDILKESILQLRAQKSEFLDKLATLREKTAYIDSLLSTARHEACSLCWRISLGTRDSNKIPYPKEYLADKLQSMKEQALHLEKIQNQNQNQNQHNDIIISKKIDIVDLNAIKQKLRSSADEDITLDLSTPLQKITKIVTTLTSRNNEEVTLEELRESTLTIVSLLSQETTGTNLNSLDTSSDQFSSLDKKSRDFLLQGTNPNSNDNIINTLRRSVRQPPLKRQGPTVRRDARIQEIVKVFKSMDKTSFWRMEFEPWNYSTEQLIAIFVFIMEDLGFVRVFKIPLITLFKFTDAVSLQYNSDNPFHNFAHAIDICQTLYIWSRNCDIKRFLLPLDLFALFLAALCHDIDHPGFNNNFLVKTNNKLSLLYNDISVLEMHHCSFAFTLLKKPELNILFNLSSDQYQNFRRFFIQAILATDMSLHFELLSKMQIYINQRQFDNENTEDRLFFAKLLLHAADISNPTRSWEIAKYWGYQCQAEFLNQGDREKKLKMPVSPYSDRNNSNIVKMSISFIDFMIHPFFSEFRFILPELGPLLSNLKKNRLFWGKELKKLNKPIINIKPLPSPKILPTLTQPILPPNHYQLPLSGVSTSNINLLNKKKRESSPVVKLQPHTISIGRTMPNNHSRISSTLRPSTTKENHIRPHFQRSFFKPTEANQNTPVTISQPASMQLTITRSSSNSFPDLHQSPRNTPPFSDNVHSPFSGMRSPVRISRSQTATPLPRKKLPNQFSPKNPTSIKAVPQNMTFGADFESCDDDDNMSKPRRRLGYPPLNETKKQDTNSKTKAESSPILSPRLRPRLKLGTYSRSFYK